MDPRVQHIFENSLKLSLRIPDRLNAERLVPYPVCQRLFMRGLRPLTKLVLIVFFAARVFGLTTREKPLVPRVLVLFQLYEKFITVKLS